MAHSGHRVDQEKFSCSLCLDLLKDPVTTSCGHSYCRSCINNHWDTEDQRMIYSCPQCRQTFMPRPVLGKNTMLAELVEDLKKTGLQAAPADHDPVSAAQEWLKRLPELYTSQRNIRQRIQDKERDVKLLQQEVEAINSSADKAVENSEKIFTELIRQVKQQVRSQQLTVVSRVRELEEKLEQEITELKRKDQELEKLSHTQNCIQFVQGYPSVLQLKEHPGSSNISELPLWNFEGVTVAVSKLREKLQDVLRGTWSNISETETQWDVLLPEPEPKTRAQFFRYSRNITLDPNTANMQMILSDENRKVQVLNKDRPYSEHPAKFSFYQQVLSKESLTGRCYCEVEVRGRVFVAVSYKSICRQGRSNECKFGSNDKSWALNHHRDGFVFWHDNVRTPVSGPFSSRVGVYLDQRAGILSFYSISETMTLLHKVETTFIEPLYAGIRIYDEQVCGHLSSYGFSAEFCKLK